jgi:inner membrane protein
MPSPIGHALAAAAVGWAIAATPSAAASRRQVLLRQGCAFAGLGLFPDIDLLVGVHRGPTHGIGAAMIAGAVAFALTRQARLAVACAAAYSTHTLLDWLGSDTSTPVGLMALWPFSSDYYYSSLGVFDAITRRYWLPGFWTQNLRAVVREIVILLPVAVLAGALRSRGQEPRSPGAGPV